MRKFLILLIIPLIIVILLLVGAIGATTTLKTIPCDLTVVKGTEAVNVYIDSACTTEITSLHFGNVARGSSTSVTMYVKNTGVEVLTITMAATGSVPGTASFSPTNFSISAGDMRQVDLTISIPASTTLAPYSFQIEVQSS